MTTIHNYLILLIIVLFSALMWGCSTFLDAKPDQSLAIPETLEDLQHVLDNAQFLNLNSNFPGLGEQYTDDWLLDEINWSTLTQDERENYCFEHQSTNEGRWSGPYTIVFYANLVLDGLSKINEPSTIFYDRQHIEGAALFFRSHAYFQLLQVFAKHYDPDNSNHDLGIVLRDESGIDEVLRRASVRDSYDRVLADLNRAIVLLPENSLIATRPNRAAAYALLSRIYLLIGDFYHAGLYADSALTIHNKLLDYNELDLQSNNPFPIFNDEVIFQSRMTALAMNPARATIHPNLLALYCENDLRKPLFFQLNTNGTYRFKGFYDGLSSTIMFNGISTAELFLTKAECMSRLGKQKEALTILNELLVTRWVVGEYHPYTVDNTDDVLAAILTERRKELPYRGLRWLDLRRLSKEGYHITPIIRELGGKIYTLDAKDIPEMAFRLPDGPIDQGGYTQN